MNIELDMVAIIQQDSLRHQINAELREKFSRFRIVLMEGDDLKRFDQSFDLILREFNRRAES